MFVGHDRRQATYTNGGTNFGIPVLFADLDPFLNGGGKREFRGRRVYAGTLDEISNSTLNRSEIKFLRLSPRERRASAARRDLAWENRNPRSDPSDDVSAHGLSRNCDYTRLFRRAVASRLYRSEVRNFRIAQPGTAKDR